MTTHDTRRGLGRGLRALVPDLHAVPPAPPTQLRPARRQPDDRITRPPAISLSPADHLERAEQLLDMAEGMAAGTPFRLDALATAQVHATLALVKKGEDT